MDLDELIRPWSLQDRLESFIDKMQIFDTSLMKTTTDILIDTTHVTLFFPEYIHNVTQFPP